MRTGVRWNIEARYSCLFSSAGYSVHYFVVFKRNDKSFYSKNDSDLSSV